MSDEETEPTKNDPQSLSKDDVSSDLSEGAEASESTRRVTPPEILESLPPEQQEQVAQFIGSHTSMTVGPAVNPIAEKVTAQHITDVIGLSGRRLDREFEDRKHSRMVFVLFAAFAVAILVGFSIFLAVQGMTDLLQEVIKGLVIFGGGFGAGYGFSAFRR